MINQFCKCNSLWFFMSKFIKSENKNVLLFALHNNNYTFILWINKVNIDPQQQQQKGCTKVSKEIDLIFIQLPIKFFVHFFVIGIPSDDRKVGHIANEYTTDSVVFCTWNGIGKANIILNSRMKSRQSKNKRKRARLPLNNCHSHIPARSLHHSMTFH